MDLPVRNIPPGMLQLAYLALGAGAGALGALLGVGGGIVLVPALIFLGSLSFTAAVGTSLVCVVATSVAGSAVQFTRGAVDAELALRLQSFAVAGAVCAGLAAPHVPVRALYVAFGALLLVAAWHSWPRGSGSLRHLARPHRVVAGATAAAGGAIGGLLGVGGGIVFNPLLHLVLGMDFHRSAATSLYLIGLTAASGALVYVSRGDVAPAHVAPTMLGVLVGAALAARLARRIAAAWLKRAFSVLLLYVAVRMLLRALGHA